MKRILAVGGIALVTLSSCASGSAFDEAALDDADRRLDAAYVAAFVVGNDEIIGQNRDSGPSYLLLVRADGDYDTIVLGDLIGGDVAWTDRGVFFGDGENDYLLDGDGLAVVPSPKHGAEQNFVQRIGDTHVSLYNVGFIGDGYVSQIVATGDTATSYDAQGAYLHNAVCGGTLFGVTTDPGLHRGDYDGDAEQVEFLTQLYPAVSGRETLTGWRDTGTLAASGPDLACRDGVISFLAVDAAGDQSEAAAVLVNWDTGTGDSTETPMTRDDGTPVLPSDFGFAPSCSTIVDDALEWMSPDGTIHATDLETGATTPRFATPASPHEDFGPSTLLCTEDTITVLTETPYGDPEIVVIDRSTGDITHRVAVPGLRHTVDTGTFAIWSYAITPQWS